MSEIDYAKMARTYMRKIGEHQALFEKAAMAQNRRDMRFHVNKLKLFTDRFCHTMEHLP